MDFLGALSGLERIAIIAGAMLVGFWGYRLFAKDRTPGLIFMGIACAVLLGALITGTSHIRNLGESYQLATAGHPSPPAPDAAAAPSEATATAVPQPDAGALPVADLVTAAPVAPPGDPTAEPPPPEAPPGSSQPAAEPAETPGLLSSQELGGRIVSVKSETISLEWAPRRR